MYSNYNMTQNYQNMYPAGQNFQNNFQNSGDERFIGGGLLAPFLLGGVAGYAIGGGRPNSNYYPPYNYSYNNYYGAYPYYPYYPYYYY